ncbi:MAG: 16S rRNA (guanine(527)-N(7))-methyltransferase RsmG [Dehalococcoidia bacterium]|nr:16S rRNA (guanine(527)-N(7))-methyltransferase RsmG [Dehalococcoidia bacterium]
MNTHPVATVNFGWPDLPSQFPSFPRPERWLPLLQHHAELVEAAAGRVRVSAVLPEDAVRRQYAESLELLRIVREHTAGGPLADVGSGGGFPGLVIAAVEPDLEVHLVEPLQKRARLLEELAAAMDLPNVRVHAVRAEEAGRRELRDRCAVVTARAVAALRELLEYTAPLAAPGGQLAFPKGSALDEELAEAGGALAALGCEVVVRAAMRPEVSDTPSVLLVRKLGETPAAYPRRPGMPAKRPL